MAWRHCRLALPPLHPETARPPLQTDSIPWPVPIPSSSVRAAAAFSPNGLAAATAAVTGTRSSRKRQGRPRLWVRAPVRRNAPARARSISSTWAVTHPTRRGWKPVSPSSTGSAEAGWFLPRRFWSAAIPESANRPSCFRPSPVWQERAYAPPTSRAKRAPGRFAAAPSGWGLPMRRSSWPVKRR